MLVAIIATDKPGHLQTRLDNRDAHLAYGQSSGKLVMAGPFLNDGGEMCGSLLILEVDTMQDAYDFADNDPYAKAGLFEKVRIEQWKKVIG
ncbi:YciI family protein [Hasllibacter sp. MH4015]|uniref:YciI family protein n=1 Tax=Hasllibacter sp. MH4015 TaxID=2854029 RepID=UPI001CD360BE|nr:YciI family protein [Hasllibacter sp. MH4015]